MMLKSLTAAVYSPALRSIMKLIHLRIVMLLLMVIALVPAGAVTVSISGIPSNLEPGQNLNLTLHYQRTGNESEKRLVYFLQMHRLSDGALLQKRVADNSGQGYPTLNGQISFNFTAPGVSTGHVYFEAWAVPWSLNRAAVEHYKTYPTDGTFTYLWSGGGHGVTQNVFYRGALICPKPAGNTTYCSGLSFETFLVSYNNYNTTYGHATINNMTSSQMHAFRGIWYGTNAGAEKLAAQAIPDFGLGLEITDFEEAQEGDAIQFWRNSGSGHNPIFVRWVRSNGQITGVRYWGSQPSTNGIGYQEELFGTSGSRIVRDRFYIGRPRKPRDQADYDWALATSSTQSSPTPIGVASSVSDWELY